MARDDDVAVLAEHTDMLQQALEQFRFEASKLSLNLHLSWQKKEVQNLGTEDQEPDVVASWSKE